ncbi:MAG: polysaccharide biosynthesis tyrosine autokinase [Bacteroidia bacterium]
MPTKTASIIDLEDIKSLMRILSKNWYVLLVSLVFFYAIYYVYSYRLTNVYAAKSQILLEANDQQLNEQSLISESFGYGYWNQASIDNATQIRILKSYDLVEKAVIRMDLMVSYFIVGRVKTTEAYKGMPFQVFVDKINPNLLEQQIEFKITGINTYQLKIKKDNEEVLKNGVFDQPFIDPDLKITVKNNNVTKENVAEFMNMNYLIQMHSLSTVVNGFQYAMSVEIPEMTSILEVTVEDVLPERAKDFLDTLSTVYIENSIKSRLDLNANTLKYIDKQMDELSEVLTHIEDTMQGYKEKKHILDLGKEEDDYFKKMSQYDDVKSKLNLQIASLNSLESYIIEDKDPQFLPPAIYIVNDDAFLKQSTTELYVLQIKMNENLSTVTGTNYAITESQQKVEKMKKNLLIYIDNSRRALQQNIEDINKQIEFYVAGIKTIPQKQRDLLGIQRNFEVNQKMYLFLLEKKSNNIIGRAAILPNTKIIEAARSMGVIKPNKEKILYSFLGIALVLASIIIFIRTNFYARVESIDELKSKTTYPVLGEILQSDEAANVPIMVHKESKSNIAESFRALRANLQYYTPNINGGKTILISSQNAGEGKTFTSINLAAILAKADKRVLLLELDLHKPKVQKALNMVSDKGISSIVIGIDTVENCIKPTEVENMYVLLSGPTPPNPSEMILSEKLTEIMEFAKSNFDYVIIDTPPVSLISDALVLMKFSDINLFVINTKFPSKASITNAHEIAHLNKKGNFAFVLNGVKRKFSKYYYNKYGYGYGYSAAQKKS